MTRLLVVILLLIKLKICSCSGNPASGPYSLTVLAMGECPEHMRGTNENRFHTRISKTSRNTVSYGGWIYLPYGMNDNQQEIWEVSVKGSTGGWRPNFIRFINRRACSDTRRIVPKWFNLLKNSLNDTSCPIPPGNYTFNGVDLSNIQFKNSPTMFYGTYRVIISYYNNKTHVGCTMYEAEIHPRVASDQPEASGIPKVSTTTDGDDSETTTTSPLSPPLSSSPSPEELNDSSTTEFGSKEPTTASPKGLDSKITTAVEPATAE